MTLAQLRQGTKFAAFAFSSTFITSSREKRTRNLSETREGSHNSPEQHLSAVIYKHTSPGGKTFITLRLEELRKRRVCVIPLIKPLTLRSPE